MSRGKFLQLANINFKKYLSSSKFIKLWTDRVNLSSFQNTVNNRFNNVKSLLIHINFRSNIKNLPRQKKLRSNSLLIKLKKIILKLRMSSYSSTKLPLLLLYTGSKFSDRKELVLYQNSLDNTQGSFFKKRKTTLINYYNLGNLVSNKLLLHFYSNSNYSYLFTKHGNSFVLANLGIFIPFIFLYKNNTKLYKYVLKKKMYSFLKINEYKMHIFRSKRSLMTNNLISRVRGLGFFNRAVFTSHGVFYNYFKKITSESKSSLRYLSNTSNTFLNESLFLKSNIFNYDGSSLRSKLFHNKNLPPVISRVRFKPGYQRIWRHYRLALAESINFNYIYQKQLTRFLIKFYRKSISSQFSFNENSIDKITIYSRLVPDKFTFDLFFRNKLIYFNSSTLLSDVIYVYKNDFIQVEISIWYYVFSRWISNFLLTRKKKFKRLIFRKSLSSRYMVMKQIKQKSNYTPNWIRNVLFDFSDIKPFLEVDFFTLSCFLIYDYNRLTHYTPQDIKVVKFNLYRLYNWKYIT